MALLVPGGHLGGLGGSANGTGGSGEGAWAPPRVPGGLRWGSETGGIAHLLHPCSLPKAAKKKAPKRSAKSKKVENILDPGLNPPRGDVVLSHLSS